MGKQSIKIEWQIQDEEQAKRQSAPPDPRSPEMAASNGLDFRWYVSAALVILVLVGAWIGYQAEKAAVAYEAQVKTELGSSVQAELWVAAEQDTELAIDLSSDPAVPAWHRSFGRDERTVTMLQTISSTFPLAVEFQVIELEGVYADVMMTIRAPRDGINLRQRRFYRHTATGWLRTAPSVEHWGPSTSLESKEFIFTFYKHDAGTVERIAPQLDTLYSNLRRHLGLPTFSPHTKILVEISPSAVPGEALLRSSPAHYVVPAPDLYLAPSDVSDEHLLLQSLILVMIPNLVDETFAAHKGQWVHQQIRHALQLWLLWDVKLPLAAAREPLVQWRLRDMSSAVQGKVAPLPQQYGQQCLLHNMWLASPSLLMIPLTCDEDDHALMLAPAPKALSVPQLEQLIATLFLYREPPIDNAFSTAQPGDAILMATLFEYIMSHYGSERLPPFLSALGQPRSWTTICPALFRVTSTEFATGWRNFLEMHYRLRVAE